MLYTRSSAFTPRRPPSAVSTLVGSAECSSFHLPATLSSQARQLCHFPLFEKDDVPTNERVIELWQNRGRAEAETGPLRAKRCLTRPRKGVFLAPGVRRDARSRGRGLRDQWRSPLILQPLVAPTGTDFWGRTAEWRSPAVLGGAEEKKSSLRVHWV